MFGDPGGPDERADPPAKAGVGSPFKMQVTPLLDLVLPAKVVIFGCWATAGGWRQFEELVPEVGTEEANRCSEAHAHAGVQHCFEHQPDPSNR
ncbi:hypothetical protein PCANC_12166 [Puccinia coronata f. sp. avenae]|uniref:Uncharacterized protein n=1 Tax=Puccinia coronata f. sp. avenae TaxID=200324 RepID=A0A2N5S0R4_9BASI|nr:hypothetical protein PCANC_26963 [Puccinia coronata f. sp. avenae]PLW49095.1 hypothetical protein PCANC_12166 [Puccinia coronata f. sp. avenae]